MGVRHERDQRIQCAPLDLLGIHSDDDVLHPVRHARSPKLLIVLSAFGIGLEPISKIALFVKFDVLWHAEHQGEQESGPGRALLDVIHSLLACHHLLQKFGCTRIDRPHKLVFKSVTELLILDAREFVESPNVPSAGGVLAFCNDPLVVRLAILANLSLGVHPVFQICHWDVMVALTFIGHRKAFEATSEAF